MADFVPLTLLNENLHLAPIRVPTRNAVIVDLIPHTDIYGTKRLKLVVSIEAKNTEFLEQLQLIAKDIIDDCPHGS